MLDICSKGLCLIEGGLKTSIERSVIWEDVDKSENIKREQDTQETRKTGKKGNYIDESKDILKEMRFDLDEEDVQEIKSTSLQYCQQKLTLNKLHSKVAMTNKYSKKGKEIMLSKSLSVFQV